MKRVWRHARGSGLLHVEPIGPYDFVRKYFCDEGGLQSSGERLASWVVRTHMVGRHKLHGLSRSLAEVARMIALTQHWTPQELATAALPGVEQDSQIRAERTAASAAQPPERSRAASTW